MVSTLQAAPSTVHDRAPRYLYMSLDLSKSRWALAFSGGGQKTANHSVAAGDERELLKKIASAKKRLGLGEDVVVCSCYEAGRDGFWVHHFLTELGIHNIVVDAASMKVDRNVRRAKTDSIDVMQMLVDLVRYHRGETDVWSVVRIPDESVEDERHLHRGLERLKKERTQLRGRITSLLATQGVRARVTESALRDVDSVEEFRDWRGESLLPGLKGELRRMIQRLDLVETQIAAIDRERRERVSQASEEPDPALDKVRLLESLRGIGVDSAWLLVREFFWRTFDNRRQVAGAAGLGGTPYSSGNMNRELGISKAGNARIRTRLIELAWMWIRLQPDSKRTRWFKKRFGDGGKRSRRRGIVALARMLLIDFWHLAEHGVIPPGAELKTARTSS